MAELNGKFMNAGSNGNGDRDIWINEECAMENGAVTVINGVHSINLNSGNQKREDYINWSDYFMAVAFLSSMRSKDPCTQVGACIVNSENKIVGIGYNGMPRGCDDDEFPWGKSSAKKVENKYFYVCHAEMNAILNKIVGELKDCRIFVALFPCNECAKLIIQSGIREVIYLSDKNWHKDECVATRKMFDSAGVIYTKYTPTAEKIVIDFASIDLDRLDQDPPTPRKSNSPKN